MQSVIIHNIIIHSVLMMCYVLLYLQSEGLCVQRSLVWRDKTFSCRFMTTLSTRYSYCTFVTVSSRIVAVQYHDIVASCHWLYLDE